MKLMDDGKKEGCKICQCKAQYLHSAISTCGKEPGFRGILG